LIGGDGSDTASYEANYGCVLIDMAAGTGWWNSAEGDRLSSIENVVGTDWSDWLAGDEGANILVGGKGNDTLTGRAGPDVFVFDMTPNDATNVDVITDFQLGADKIHLSSSVFGVLGQGVLSSLAYHVGTEATSDAQHIIYDDVSGAVYYDADGSGSIAQVLVVNIGVGLSLSSSDFFVY
jgi:Ca2+-binding RTX toxin-like protein